MSRIKEIRKFIEFDRKHNFYIESEVRFNATKERLFNILETYNPGVIVKAGLGNGRILLDIAREFNPYLIVVEPSLNIIKEFLQENKGSESIENIHFINGDFQNFPVDYFAVELLICIDFLDIIDSSKCVDEFKRAIKVDKLFFLSGVALNGEDIEGIYDDFMHMIFPLHNDYYLKDDLETFMELKGLTLIKNIILQYEKNLESEMDYFSRIYKDTSKENAHTFIRNHEEDFKKIYDMDESLNISETYYIGVFQREKPKETT